MGDRPPPGRAAAAGAGPPRAAADLLTLDAAPCAAVPRTTPRNRHRPGPLASAVSTLSPAEREVWRLMYVEDRPVAEVAKLTGVPEGTVKSRAHRARRLLRAALGGGLG